MNELRRTAYLDALGIVSYVSRQQLPGAAVTRRLAVVAAPQGKVKGAALFEATPEHPVPLAARPSPNVRPVVRGRRPEPPPTEKHARQRSASVPRFSLAAIVAGHWLWLEDLAGMPLTSEQVRLVQAMARALLASPGQQQNVVTPGPAEAVRADVAQFDWPIHTNHQLDLDVNAARAGVQGFLGRRLEQHGCRGLVLLGRPCTMWLHAEALSILTVSTASTAEMLASPSLKREVWRDILPLVSTL